MVNLFTPNQTYDSFNELYFVTQLMAADLKSVIHSQVLGDDHAQFLIYQVIFSTCSNNSGVFFEKIIGNVLVS